MPHLRAALPSAIDMTIALDRTTTIRASLRDVEFSMLLSTALVIMVVFLFLRSLRAIY
jgi:multidrug efflux pump